jgi:hypothetical protein
VSEEPGFAVPPFRPAEALVQLKRQVRDLKPLAERGSRYEIKGRPVLELAADETTLIARIARRPTAAPEWTTTRLGSSLDVRRFLDDLRKRLKTWETEE